MRFGLNDEQVALQDATRDFLSSKVTSDLIRSAIVTEHGFDKDLFSSICNDLGLVSLVISENSGGFGATDVELAVALEQHGYFLAPTPLRTQVSTAIVLSECAPDSKYIQELVGGEQLATTIFTDDDFTVNFDTKHDSIDGRFARVLFGASIKHLFFPLQMDNKCKLMHLDLEADGVSQFVTPSIDQTQPLGSIECENVSVDIIADDISIPFERAKSRAIIAACNEMVGSTQRVIDMSVAYAKDRNQFSRPIGSFQAIKHKCAEMLLETESARSISYFGAWLASQDEGYESDALETDLSHTSSMAKYYVSNAFSHCAGENIQIHGGIGFTMEHDAQLFFKRAAFMKAHLGLPHEHSAQIAAALIERV